MSDGKEMTYAEVAEHTGKKDLFVVIHDEVFDTSSFVDEHPYVSACQQYCPYPGQRTVAVTSRM